ncbi:type II toxin-antitoxin system RelB/DinJ family antitoxin [Levilactobacillus mulengensis]|jgi:DNA-damage-inducible protein J|uniref:type II toxin-antitoxin system RelB/DinJ family antitoxin n=1 Tax=Levilactobacillus mulengensis TaxID=2486025 RepID=UPI000F7B1704|nr:type II toxin-antitoxin system RelB/DinJ family antitoxin [Levilactobacillus mulengensis]
MTKLNEPTQPEHLDLALDPQLKRDATAVYQQYGMSLTTAIHLFLQQSVTDHDLPFDLELSKEQLQAELAREKATGDTQSLAAVEALWQDWKDL